MRVGILGQRQGWHTQTLLAALARRGITAECFPVTQLTARVAAHPRLTVRAVTLEAYDTLFVRAIPGGSLEQIIFRVDALHRLEHLGVRVVNSAAAIERGVDKYYTATLLEDAGLPTPRTVVTECWDDALAAFHELGGDVVVKPLFGSEGRGMVRVSDADTAYRVLRALELGRYVYCLQEFVPHGCEDIRVFVVGGQVVGAMLRRGKDWKTNAAQGAEGQPYDVDDRVGEMSVRAAQVLGAEHAGVDILPCDAGGYAVLEVNTIPGWRALRSATGVDAAQHLVDHVLGGLVESARGIEIAWAAQLACVFEVNAEKPGNVTRRANFRDARFEDFLASAVAVGPAFQDAARAAVGETILRAVRDTRRFVRTNTNLGVILLLGPLAKAAGQGGPEGLRAAVAHVLNGLTVEDARKTYEAIRLSAPSGLGQVERHGVHVRDVDVTLRQAMDLARGRDSVAREYVTDFEISLGLGYGTLRQSWAEGCTLSDSVVQTFLTVLAEVPDTLIARKKGQAAAEEVSRRAAEVLAAGGCLSKGGRDELARLDCDLRDESHVLNPGTTADLVAASLFAFLTEGGMLESVPDLVARW